ncbi:MAG: TIGR00282 family metallophosphoesterase [Candidatus Muiribacteriota bacterium]
MRILFIGDVDDKPGINITRELLPLLKKEYSPDIIVVNGENSASGLGIDKAAVKILTEAGADIITLGNHTWSNKEIHDIFKDKNTNVIRPINFPSENPGNGFKIIEKKGHKILVINAHGQESIVNILGKEIFTQCDSPFHVVDKFLKKHEDIKIIFIDFHAESTIEKMAFGRFLDGRVSCVAGTHTHVQTADEQIMPKGTAYITDVGMTGATNSIAGVEEHEVIDQYLKVRPTRWKGSQNNAEIKGIVVDIDNKTGKAVDIFRISKKMEPGKIHLTLTNEVLSGFLSKIMEYESLESIAKYMINLITSKTTIKKAGFFEKDSINTIIRYSTLKDEDNEKVKKYILKTAKKGFHRIDEKLCLIVTQDEENKEVFYFIVFNTKHEIIIENSVMQIFKNFYSRLRKVKLLIQSNDELSVLYEVGKEVAQTIELYGKDGLLSKIMELATKIMNCEASSVILVDERKNELYFIIGLGEKGDAIKEIRLKMGQGIAGWVAETRQAAIVPDTSKDDRFFSQADKKTDYQTKSIIAVPMIVKNKVIGVLEVLNKKGEIPFNEGDLSLLEGIARQAAAAIDNAKLYERIKMLYKATVEVLANAMDSKDAYTHGHSRRVAEYSVAIAEEMKMSESFLQDLEIAALLHDIGKIGIRDAILCKPGRLTDDEFKVIQSHPVISAKILEPVDFLRDLIPMIRHHHERYDGNGYPAKLKGDDIPVGSRIIAVADTFDAMTSDRAYRKGLPWQVAIEELKNNRGTQFDFESVDAFLRAFEKKYKDNFEEIKSRFAAQDKIIKN